MESRRSFKVKVISANDLENVRKIFRTRAYAEVSIHGVERTKIRTHVDKVNETNPIWNSTIEYTLDDLSLEIEVIMLVVRLYTERNVGDGFIGEVKIPIKQLFEKAVPGGKENGICTPVASYKVCKDSVASCGEVSLSCSFGEKVMLENEGFWKKALVSGIKWMLHAIVQRIIHVLTN